MHIAGKVACSAALLFAAVAHGAVTLFDFEDGKTHAKSWSRTYSLVSPSMPEGR